MATALQVIFWVSVVLLGWVYIGYPVLVGLVATLRPVRLIEETTRPDLSVAIAVHDEEAEIADRIADVFNQEASGAHLREVVIGSDGSTDRTDAIVRALAAGEPRLRLLRLPRSGQTLTQQALVDATTSDVIVLSDAETRFAPGCLAALAAVFGDPRVGCATGRLEWADESATATSRNEGLYWRYERWVRGLESRAGWLTAVTGAVLATRRSAYRPVPATSSADHLLPLYVREQGGLVVYVPAARAIDRPISGVREQYRSRTRTATRGIQANLSMVVRLALWRRPSAAVAIWSHKLLRWATPLLLFGAASSGLLLAALGQMLYGTVALLLVVGLAGAVLAHLLTRAGRRPPAPFAFARAFAVVNLAFLVAWLNVVQGRRIHSWHRVEWETRSDR